MDVLSDEGRKLFGKFLWYCAEQQGLTSQAALAAWISEAAEHPVPESQINTLIKGKWERSFQFNYLFALLDSAILRFPDSVENGRLLELADIMEIFRGRLDPFTGKRLGSGNGANVT